MRNLCLIFIALLLGGCGTTSSVKFTSEPLVGNTSFTFTDERQESQKHSRIEESSDGKNHIFGDDNLNPTGPELLKKTLQTKIGSELSGKSISVIDFSISVYEPSVSIDREGLHASAASVPNGYAAEPLAELLILAIEGMKSEKSVLVQVAGKIDNTIFSGGGSGSFKGHVTDGNIKDVVDQALEEVILHIKSILASKKQSS